MKDIMIGFGIDVDAVCGWLGSFGGENSWQAVSRSMFAGEVGIPRVLALLRRHGIKATWFAPGHSIETFPAEIEAVVAAGHELGAHGYSHEKPSVRWTNGRLRRPDTPASADRAAVVAPGWHWVVRSLVSALMRSCLPRLPVGEYIRVSARRSASARYSSDRAARPVVQAPRLRVRSLPLAR